MVPRVSAMPLKDEVECGGEMVEMNQLNCPGPELPQVHHARTQKLVDPGGDHCQKSGAGMDKQSLHRQFVDSTVSPKDNVHDGAVSLNGHITQGNAVSARGTGARIDTDNDEEDEEFEDGDISSRPLLARRREEVEGGEMREGKEHAIKDNGDSLSPGLSCHGSGTGNPQGRTNVKSSRGNPPKKTLQTAAQSL